MPFEATIASFAAALANPSAPAPYNTRGRLGGPDSRRFSVYRNNVAVGLIGALEARYPVVRRIVGPDVFRAMARAFAAAHRPSSPVMIAYGDAFPDFLAKAGADLELPFLPDVARLENAWIEAYHAADATVATLSDLAAMAPAELPRSRIEFHPAARLLRFATPAASIWAACQSDAAAVPPPGRSQGEDVLVVRPEADVSVHVLPPGGYVFATRLRDGSTLAGAAEALPSPEDFGAHIVGLVESGAVASIMPGDPS
jgi:Putative DNA-binding domain